MTERLELVLVDADGTLVGPDGVPPSAWAAVRRGRAAGLRFALCTGRGGRGTVLDLARGLAPAGPHAVDAGAAVVFADGQALHADQLSAEQVQQVARAAAEGGHTLELYTPDGRFLSLGGGPGVEAHAALLGTPVGRWDPTVSEPVARAQLLVAPGEALTHARRALEAGGLEVHVGTSPRMPGYRFVGVTRAGVSKLSAARHIADWYGVGLTQTAMVGDGDNDAGVMGGVGFGVAMGNATPRTRAAARWVVGSVERGGFAEAVDRLIGLRGDSSS